MFATGLECSYPVIRGADGRKVRIDEYEKTGHYRRWREDFRLVKELGIRFLRYGVPYYRVHLGPARYDWSFVDETFQALREAEITPIADLCHFGLPDWLASYQNPDFPPHFAEFAETFAARYPWVELFTPVNEIRIACEFSALMGYWNDQEASDRAYVTALKTTARANILAEEAILAVRPHAVFVQSEATGYFHAECPAALERTHFLNQRRFISLDLCYGHEVGAAILIYLLDNGMTLDEYRWFLAHGQHLTSSCVMGNDYYATNEHMVPAGDAPLYPAGPVYGYYMLTRQYFDRYQLPVMHTETNQLGAHDPVRWLRNQWLCLVKLKEDGVPLVGFTWYSLIDQVDWDSGLRENAGHVNPFGLYDLDRKIRPVGEAYRDLIRAWKDILPMESRRLDTGLLLSVDQPRDRPTTRTPVVR
jgi:beta-glucosidase/6-phospho-beta-glucosidase/beta-galactosidase